MPNTKGQKIFGDVELQVGGSDVSASNPLPITDSTAFLPPIIDTVTTPNTIYFGFFPVGSSTDTSSAICRIMRMVETSGIFVFSFAEGNMDTDKIWNNRTSYIYS